MTYIFYFIISMRTVSSITEQKISEMATFSANNFYIGRHEGSNSACPNYVSLKGKKMWGISRHFFWDIDE